MCLKKRLSCLIITTMLMTACSDDAADIQNPTVRSPQTSVKSEDSKAKGKSKLRGGEAMVHSEFAGFGRVGRSHFSDVDYRARWAVIIGLNQFKHMSHLDNAVNDAAAVRDLLRDEFGYDEKRIIFLADQHKNEAGEVTSTEPIGKATLLKAFDDLESRDIRSNDAVLFFFAGHGKSDKQGTYLAGYDAVSDDTSTWVDAVDLKERLWQLPARHKLIILDSCYAGSILDVVNPKVMKRADVPVPPTPPKLVSLTTLTPADQDDRKRSDGIQAIDLRDNISYYLQQPAFFAITAGRDQPVGDASNEKPDHSPFTTAFLDVLKERANSLREGDVFTVRELAVRIESRVRTGQTPDWGRLEGSRGDFVFQPTRDRLTPRELAERDNYAVRLALAEVEIREANIDRARKLLDSCPKELRHYEWHRLRAIMDSSIATLEGHESAVNCVAINDAENRIVSASYDGVIKVWDAKKRGKALMTLGKSDDGDAGEFVFPISSIAISNNGKRIVSASTDGLIKVWDADKVEKPIMTLHGDGNPQFGIASIAISHDGQRIVSAFGGPIKVWDAEKAGKPILVLDDADAYSVAFSRDGKRIVSGSCFGDTTVKVWDAEKEGKPLLILRGHEKNNLVQSGHLSDFITVAFSDDDKRVVSGGWDRTIKVWDAEKGGEALLTLRGHSKPISSIAISADGERIVSGSWDRTIKVWDAKRGGEALFTLPGHRSDVNSVAISTDGKRIVSGSFDQTIKVWDAGRDGPAKFILRGHEKTVNCVAVSREGKRIVSGSDDLTIKVWDTEKDWNAPLTLEGHSSIVTTVTFSLDGKHVLSGGAEGMLKVWDAQKGGPPLSIVKPHKDGFSIVLSADGRRMVSGSASTQDATLKVWDTQRIDTPLLVIPHGHKDYLVIAFSADGKRIVTASGNGDAIIKVWDAENGGKPLHLLSAHKKGIKSVAFSNDRKWIVSGGDFNDKSIKVWDAEKGGKPLLTLDGHDGEVISVAFSADGKRIVSGSADETIRIWDAKRGGEALLILRDFGFPMSKVAFSADSKRIVVGCEDGTIKVWDAYHEEVESPAP